MSPGSVSTFQGHQKEKDILLVEASTLGPLSPVASLHTGTVARAALEWRVLKGQKGPGFYSWFLRLSPPVMTFWGGHWVTGRYVRSHVGCWKMDGMDGRPQVGQAAPRPQAAAF